MAETRAKLTRALSIMQPWAWLIVNGHKDIENRSWYTSFRGPVLIHAGKKVDSAALSDVMAGIHPVSGEWFPGFPIPEVQAGGIVGECEIVDCVKYSESPWFVGRYGFVIRNARPLPFRPCRGALGFFDPENPAASFEHSSAGRLALSQGEGRDA